MKKKKKMSSQQQTQEFDEFKMELTSELEETCTSFPFDKAFGKGVTGSCVEMKYQYQVCQIKGFVKWEVLQEDDGATGPTHAQISLHRQNLQSPDPFKKPICVPLARCTTGASAAVKESFDITEDDDKMNLFWKPGDKGETRFVRIKLTRIVL